MSKILANSSGDTIVEVLLATVILSTIIAGAFTISNRATQVAQNSAERTQVSNELQAQVEVVRAMRDINTDSWRNINSRASSATAATASYSSCEPTSGSAAFYIDYSADLKTNDAIVDYTVTASGNQVDSNTGDFFSIWIEAYKPSGQTHVDLHARACWKQIGGDHDGVSSLVYRLQGPTL